MGKVNNKPSLMARFARFWVWGAWMLWALPRGEKTGDFGAWGKRLEKHRLRHRALAAALELKSWKAALWMEKAFGSLRHAPENDWDEGEPSMMWRFRKLAEGQAPEKNVRSLARLFKEELNKRGAGECLSMFERESRDLGEASNQAWLRWANVFEEEIGLWSKAGADERFNAILGAAAMENRQMLEVWIALEERLMGDEPSRSGQLLEKLSAHDWEKEKNELFFFEAGPADCMERARVWCQERALKESLGASGKEASGAIRV